MKQNLKFLKLKFKWYGKLKETGFKDIEDEYGNLKEEGSHRKITKRAQNMAEIGTKIERIAQYLDKNPLISRNAKKILELYIQGKKQVQIANQLDLSYDYVREVVTKTLTKI